MSEYANLKKEGFDSIGFEDIDNPNSLPTYDTISLLPLSGNKDGQLAFVSENDRLYIWNTSGWYSIEVLE